MATPNDANTKRVGAASATPLPSVMPKNTNKIRQQILGALIDSKTANRTVKALVKDADGKEIFKETKVKRQELRNPLAYNVSEENVERLAKRWLK